MNYGIGACFLEFKWFTRWGEWFSFLAMLFGSFITNYDCEPIESNNYQDRDYHHYKYTPFRAWKWYIFFYELAFTFEAIIVPIFWILLIGPTLDANLGKDHLLSICMNHSVPFLVLLMDFFINAVPFTGRHFFFILPIGLSYLVVNYLVVKSTGEPVYPFLDWKSQTGLIAPFAIVFAAVVIF